MKVVIPLAGPDFERADGGLKSEQLVDGRTLLEVTLEHRPWWRSGDVTDADLVFVFKDSPRVRAFIEGALLRRYPRSNQVLLSTFTGGAALSALAGVAMVGNVQEPLCIDLVDIMYASAFDPLVAFKRTGVGAIALTFPSRDPIYSYLRTDESGKVVEAAEKCVISSNASAGTYFFASPLVFLEAIAYNIRNRSSLFYKDQCFVCPLCNGVIAAGLEVILESVHDVRDIKAR
jgi:hypothetical protein